MAGLKHWIEIAGWAVICLWEEVKGEEVSCPKCWKCDMMRVVVLTLGCTILALLGKMAFRYLGV